jgi:glyoxylase I family protein
VKKMGEKPLLKRLDHIEYIVKDVDAFVDFMKMFGFETVRETDHHHGSAEISIPGDDLIIEVHRVEGDENPGINHIGWYATEQQIQKIAEILKEKNIEHTSPRFFEPTGRILLNFRDPDGFRAQIIAIPDKKD